MKTSNRKVSIRLKGTEEFFPQVQAGLIVQGVVQQLVSHESCIQGGAPRDWFLGQEARDIDIFCCVYGEKAQDRVKRVFTALGITDAEMLGKESNEYKDFQLVYEFTYNGYLMNLIIANSPEHIRVRSWKHDISKFTFNPFNLECGGTEEAVAVFEHKVIAKGTCDRSRAYIRKMIKRYPFLTEVDDSELELPYKLETTLDDVLPNRFTTRTYIINPGAQGAARFDINALQEMQDAAVRAQVAEPQRPRWEQFAAAMRGERLER